MKWKVGNNRNDYAFRKIKKGGKRNNFFSNTMKNSFLTKLLLLFFFSVRVLEVPTNTEAATRGVP